ncbi:glycosyltransferase [Kitasatospora sp. NPDC057015]|uniref:glycosyltransferase n=1 Tax=Kitasatospora sp. NPDC057015 TaxID=3346001 RepID=UPI00363339EA
MRQDTPGTSPGTRTGPADGADPAKADELAQWRRHFWGQDPPAGAGHDLLGLLARAEYDPAVYDATEYYSAGHGPAGYGPAGPGPRIAGLPAQDLRVAGLRRAVRAGRALDPAALVTAADGTATLRTALAEAWSVTVAAGHGRAATAALRSRLLAAPPAEEAAFLLDLAGAARLRPLTAAECAGGARAADRWQRHAVWRYLSGLPRGAEALPTAAHRTADRYEELLLAAAWEQAAPGTPAGEPFRRALGPLPAAPADGLVVAQSMLLGRLDEPGAGLSGGMSVLLGGLGDELSRTGRVARVLTLVGAGTAELREGRPLVARRGPEHWVMGIPIDAPGPLDPGTAAVHRGALAWWATRLLALPGAGAHVVHARFADDCSLAVADAARRRGARFAFTVTPDPHRTTARRHRDLPVHSLAEPAAALRMDLHRIFVADALVARADLLVTIPGRSGTAELSEYFPQLAPEFRRRPLAAPPEGIAPFEPGERDDATAARLMGRLFAGGELADGLDPAVPGLRVLLSVGRLHPVKQQDRLVEAWLDAGLYRSTALVLIGGSAVHPTAVETEMRGRIAKLLSAEPAARRRVAQWAALPNRQVRVLERALASGRWCGPALYVCPSAKEEFGLAVLEAMDAGLPAAGPVVGGVPHYVRDGVNGFLLPTGSTGELAGRLRELCLLPATRLAEVAVRGRGTVAARYSAAAMAESLAAEYAAVAGGADG